MSATLVLGIGNGGRGDDGAGLAVARRLRGQTPPHTVVAESDGEVAGLLEAFEGRARVILVDCARSGCRPGTVRRFDARAGPLPAPLDARSTHGLGVAQAVELARALDRLPSELVVYAIEGRSCQHAGPLSPEVEEAVRAVERRIRAEVEGASCGAPATRRELRVTGAVQGVGFRPFVYRLAQELGLGGFVENSNQGVTIEVEGDRERVGEFERRVVRDAPVRARIRERTGRDLPTRGSGTFEIRRSETTGPRGAVVLPDIATCPECLAELRDPRDRRHRYPFVNCTQCGPRYSIVLDLPYDRARTTMARFEMCPRCRAEYVDPRHRRFHAEPNACAECGPRLSLWDAGGSTLGAGDAALLEAARALRDGRIVAVKGLGGFHLVVDARNEQAVGRLRARKHREAKPLAVMAPSLDAVARLAVLEAGETDLMASPEAPIVLVRRRLDAGRDEVAPGVAPGNPLLGLFLPYTPLHHLLTAELGFPVVATSGNLSDEPICTDEREAVSRLGGIADLFLVHDRPIARPVDDSVVRLVAGRPLLLRRARGYAPLPVGRHAGARDWLAVGGHQKNAVALTSGPTIVVGPHVGDLDTAPAMAALAATTEALTRLYGTTPAGVACDLHPDYGSTRFAGSLRRPIVAVQHHHAHALACLADNELTPPALALAWDGSGYGPDGTVWGGEALRLHEDGFTRVAHLRTFPLPGGAQAVREPRRSALGLLFESRGEGVLDGSEEALWRWFTPRERSVLGRMLVRGVNSPRTSSMGRLFDGVAALLGLHPVAGFEGQAAMALEWAVDPSDTAVAPYPFALGEDSADALPVDWAGVVEALLADQGAGVPLGVIASRFHDTLASVAVALAERAGEGRVLLTGGCFQNKVLTERTVHALRRAGFEPHWHRHVPPNDGGLALGQIVAARQAGQRE